MRKADADFELTKYTLYHTLTGVLRDVYCDDLGEYRTCYNGTELYGEI